MTAPYTIDAVPAVDVDLPPTVVIDVDPEEFTLVVENPNLAQQVENVAVDVTITRPAGGFFRQGMVLLEPHVSGDTWETVPLVNGAGISTVGGRIGPVVGRPLTAPGRSPTICASRPHRPVTGSRRRSET